MSGEKCSYVSIQEDDYDDWEEETSLQPLDCNLPQQLEAVRQQAEREMQNRLGPIEARQCQHEDMVRNLQSELGSLEKATQQRLQREHNEFIGRLRDQQRETQHRLERQHNDFVGQLKDHRRETQMSLEKARREYIEGLSTQRSEYLGLFEEQDRKLTTMLEEERRQRQEAIDNLQEQINSITIDVTRKKDISRSFVVDLTKIVEDTDRLPHQRFAPGQLDAVRRNVDDARRSVDHGMPEAALSTAQRAYWDIADLRVLVIQKEQEFLLAYQVALQETWSLLEEVRANRKYQIEGREGMRKDIELQVDHWTRGELAAFENEIRTLERELASSEKTLTTERVKEILSKIEGSKPQVGIIVDHARRNILASQLRANIAELAADALRSHGYDVDDSTYEGDDERNAYVVKVKNVAGSEVVTVISPVEGEFGKNMVSIHSYDATFVDEATLLQRAGEVVGVLGENGLQVSTPQCAGSAKPEYYDILAVRQRQARETTGRI